MSDTPRTDKLFEEWDQTPTAKSLKEHSLKLEKELSQSNAKLKSLEDELSDYIELYSDWKAYATNLESAGNQVLRYGYHSPHVIDEWNKAKETRP